MLLVPFSVFGVAMYCFVLVFLRFFLALPQTFATWWFLNAPTNLDFVLVRRLLHEKEFWRIHLFRQKAWRHVSLIWPFVEDLGGMPLRQPAIPSGRRPSITLTDLLLGRNKVLKSQRSEQRSGGRRDRKDMWCYPCFCFMVKDMRSIFTRENTHAKSHPNLDSWSFVSWSDSWDKNASFDISRNSPRSSEIILSAIRTFLVDEQWW
jgi:hypothetical protein